jgi:glycosyltransferase involved in cell wall biosynthesis
MDFEYLVSVIIPVYNCEDFLGAAIDSALEQSYKKTEIIVVDDGSQDDSLSIATKYSGIRCVQIAHQGISQARNIGIQESKGDYIAFLDADDVWLKDKLKIQIDLLKKNPELWYILAKMENFCDNDNEAVCWLEKTEFDQNPIGIQTLLARKEIFNIVGLFDTHLSIGEDMDWLVLCDNHNYRLTTIILSD